MDNRPIGVFDSGVGGLTVLRELRKKLPLENFIYVGDTARVPYGAKSKPTITRFASQIMDFLMAKDVKMVVVACNTVSSNSLAFLKAHYEVPVIGVIEPGVELALKRTRNRRIGVIGTQSTIQSGRYRDLLLRSAVRPRVFEKACPLFVPLVEELSVSGPVTNLVIENYLSGMRKSNVDTLVLGCTHYPLLEKALDRFFCGKVDLINSGYSVSLEAAGILSKEGLLADRSRAGRITLFASDLNENFRRLSRIVLKERALKMHLISFD
jgi:glutamate racemase